MRRFLRTITMLAITVQMLLVGTARAADIPKDLRVDLGSLLVSKNELICLALNDYFESRGEPLRGRIAVAQVVLNRAMDARYPQNLCDVVQQNLSSNRRACQFSWFCDGRSDVPRDGRSWRQSVLLAAAMVSRDSAISDPTRGALWYHKDTIKPYWTDRLTTATTIGRHIFYRDSDPVPQWTAALGGVFPGELGSRFAVWREAQERGRPLQLAEN